MLILIFKLMEFVQVVRETMVAIKKIFRINESHRMELKAFVAKTDKSFESLQENLEGLDGRLYEMTERLDEIVGQINRLSSTNCGSHNEFSEDLSEIKSRTTDMKHELRKLDKLYEIHTAVENISRSRNIDGSRPHKSFEAILTRMRKQAADAKSAVQAGHGPVRERISELTGAGQKSK